MQTNADDSFRELIRLKNAIGEIEIELDKAHYILQDIIEDYFDNIQPTPKEQTAFLVYEKPRAAAKSYILNDILYRIQTVLSEVSENATAPDQEQEHDTKPRHPSRPAA